jgi:hypothetical protein
MKSVLLIDNGDECLKMAKSVGAELLCFNHSEHVCSLTDALQNPLLNCPFNGSKASLKQEWKPHCVAAYSHSIIFLHTSNAYSKAYFEEFCKDKVVVLFSGDLSGAWPNDFGYKLPDNARIFHRSREVLPYAADFVFEFQPDTQPPWEVFEGRSASAKIRERLFATGLLADVISKAELKVGFEEDLSNTSFLEVVLERIADKTLRDEARMSLESRSVRWSLAGCPQAAGGNVSNIQDNAQAEQELEQLLKLLCNLEK